MHRHLPSGAKYLNIDLSLHLHQFCIYMRALKAQASLCRCVVDSIEHFVAHNIENYKKNLMCQPILLGLPVLFTLATDSNFGVDYSWVILVQRSKM